MMLAKARIVNYDRLWNVIIQANVIMIVKSTIVNVYSTGHSFLDKVVERLKISYNIFPLLLDNKLLRQSTARPKLTIMTYNFDGIFESGASIIKDSGYTQSI